MIKRTPKPAQLAAMIGFALTCFVLILFLWVSFGGPVPLKAQGYRVNVTFNEAVQLFTEADVRISEIVGRRFAGPLSNAGWRGSATGRHPPLTARPAVPQAAVAPPRCAAPHAPLVE